MTSYYTIRHYRIITTMWYFLSPSFANIHSEQNNPKLDEHELHHLSTNVFLPLSKRHGNILR